MLKFILEGNIFWINNSPSQQPWKGGPGGYGKYKIRKTILTEFMSHGTGGMGDFYYKRFLGKFNKLFPFDITLVKKIMFKLGGRVPNR